MTNATPQLPVRARLYLAAIIIAGLSSIATSLYELIARPLQPDWLVLAALTVLTGSFSVKLPTIAARVSVSEAFVFSAVILFGPAPATIVAALDALALSRWSGGASRPRLRTLFNIAASTMAVRVAAELFDLLAPVRTPEATLEQLIVPVLSMAVSYFSLNSVLIATAVSLERGVSALAVWKQNFAWLGLNHLGGASVAVLVGTYRHDIDLAVLAAVIPLLVISYFTFRAALGRLEDATVHVTQLNELYLSTIETLAMAVDAKDQITHGHIRRVQVYAIELAKALGVNDKAQLNAIEAAALLHDIGKLAIPEHILNKPGKLTAAEFETMKRHADIGADLLSSIRFPYPVLPIVRHHHENWDGTGYPMGVARTDIPLGARILSVVDCFDALNSDRPYRPRLTVDEAFSVLRTRRGTMYDPVVVDTFIATYPAIVEIAAEAGRHARSLVDNVGVPVAAGPLDEIRIQSADATALIMVRSRLAETQTTTEALGILMQAVRQLTPSSGCVYFEYQADQNSLVCVYVSDATYKAVLGLSMRPGERVTGWAAANRQTISNAHATLDLGETTTLLDPSPVCTLSTVVTCGDDSALKGVLTAYSSKADAFTHRHLYVFEQLAASFGDFLAQRAMTSRSFRALSGSRSR
jgi:putative nucleotidyltransferase with HDIG domain